MILTFLVGIFGMQWNIIIIIIIITHTLNRPFSCIVTAGQLTGQLNSFTDCLHHNIYVPVCLNTRTQPMRAVPNDKSILAFYMYIHLKIK